MTDLTYMKSRKWNRKAAEGLIIAGFPQEQRDIGIFRQPYVLLTKQRDFASSLISNYKFFLNISQINVPVVLSRGDVREYYSASFETKHARLY